MKTPNERQAEYYAGIRFAPYDLVRELAIALIGSLALLVVLAAVLSSPDIQAETIKTWATNDAVDFVTTATGELAGTTTLGGYGAPYNDQSPGAVQSWGPISPQAWFGVRQPIDGAQSYVIGPLETTAPGNPDLQAALNQWKGADSTQQQKWLDAYTKALADAKEQDGQVVVAAGDYGPLPVMMNSLLTIARAGALDGYLLTTGGTKFYATDYTLPLLFMGDGGYLAGLADNWKLHGDQWGMMNETGSYPGQSWLWLYTMWYQVPPFAGAANADLLVVIWMGVLSLALVLVPFIPVLRDIPRWIPIYRLIWRSYYREGTPTPIATKPASGTTPVHGSS